MTVPVGRRRRVLAYWPLLLLTILISSALTWYKYLERVT